MWQLTPRRLLVSWVGISVHKYIGSRFRFDKAERSGKAEEEVHAGGMGDDDNAAKRKLVAMYAPKSRPRTLALALAVVAVVALAGCQQPAPKIRLLADGDYFDAGARVWCFPGQHFTGPGSCAERIPDSPRLKVTQGQQIGVEVPREVAKRGWYVSISVAAADTTAGNGDQNNGAEPQFQRGAVQRDNSYFSFTVPDFGGNNAIGVQVVAVGSGEQNSGLWQFMLLNRDAAK